MQLLDQEYEHLFERMLCRLDIGKEGSVTIHSTLLKEK